MDNNKNILSDVIFYLSIVGLTFLITWRLDLISGFPKGVDAYGHLTKIKYMINNWPNFHLNYQWDCGTPLFGGSYPPLGYYMAAGVSYFLGTSLEFSLNSLSFLSYAINNVGISWFIYHFSKSKLATLIAISLLIFTPSYWLHWAAGGTYGRVIAMGFLGLALIVATFESEKKKYRNLFDVLLSLSLAAGLCTHILIGVTAIFAVFIYLLLLKIKKIPKIMLLTLLFSSFYVSQYLFSNPTAVGLKGSVIYDPAPLSIFNSLSSIKSLNPIIFPSYLLTLIIFIYVLKKSDKTIINKINIIPYAVSVSIFLPFFIYAFIGYLPYYPKNLYVPGFTPDSAVGMFAIGLLMSMGLMIGYLDTNYLNKQKKHRIFLILFLIAIILIGFGPISTKIKSYTVDETVQDRLEIITQNLASVNNTLQQRYGTASGFDSVWFNYIYDVPQSRDYYGLGVPYPNWHAWFETSIWGNNANYNEMNFLLDWYAIQWISVGEPTYVYDKFLSKPEYYKYVNMSEDWYEFKNIKKVYILSSTNVPNILFIGTEAHYNFFLRCLAQAGIDSNSLIPIFGKSKYIDDYDLSDLEQFSSITLYGYQYHNKETAFKILETYVEAGGAIFFEANGSPDYQTPELPTLFPISGTETTGLQEWNIDYKADFISDLNYSRFAELSYNGNPWGSSYPLNIRPWAYPILVTAETPIIVGGEFGDGQVIWSGFNIFYHILSYENSEEALLLKLLLENMIKTIPVPPSYTVNFINPQTREITIDSEARGVLFKENFLPQWKAIAIYENERIDVDILFSGPGFMYVQLDFNNKLPKAIRFEYHLLPIEIMGYWISISSILFAIIYVLIQFTIRPIPKPFSWLTNRFNRWWK